MAGQAGGGQEEGWWSGEERMPRKSVKLVVVVVAAAAAAMAAYLYLLRSGGEEPTPSQPRKVVVLCGESMRPAMEDILRRYRRLFPDRVVVQYGRSGELCAQLEQTRAGDIFVCHDPFAAWASQAGLIDAWATVAYLDVVIVVPKGNPKDIKDLTDLARPGLRVGISPRIYATSNDIARAVTYSTAGQMVEHMLAGLKQREAILKNVRREAPGQRQRCQDVVAGDLDAAIVWNAVADEFRDRLEVVPIGEQHKRRLDAVTSATTRGINLREVKVTVCLTRRAEGAPAARRFYDFVVRRCKDIFAAHGFRTEGPSSTTKQAG